MDQLSPEKACASDDSLVSFVISLHKCHHNL